MKFGVNTYIWGSTFGPADFHLLPRITACRYSHVEREQKVSDHSVMILEIK